jgi:hypothetical protein
MPPPLPLSTPGNQRPPPAQAYPKLSGAAFAFLDALSGEQLFRVDGLEEGTVLLILRACAECLRHFDQPTSVQACSILENMATFVHQRRHKQYTGAADGSLPLMVGIFDRHPDVVPFLLGRLLEIVLMEDLPNCWSYSRPLLPLILLLGAEHFEALVQRMCSALVPEAGEPMYKVGGGGLHACMHAGGGRELCVDACQCSLTTPPLSRRLSLTAPDEPDGGGGGHPRLPQQGQVHPAPAEHEARDQQRPTRHTPPILLDGGGTVGGGAANSAPRPALRISEVADANIQ